jgi:hypothetical protein
MKNCIIITGSICNREFISQVQVLLVLVPVVLNMNSTGIFTDTL